MDPPPVGLSAGHANDRQPRGTVQAIEIHDIEPADHRSVQEHRAKVFPVARGSDELDDPFRRIDAVDLDRSDADGLDLVRERYDHRADRRTAVRAAEPTVVDRHQAHVGLRESAP